MPYTKALPEVTVSAYTPRKKRFFLKYLAHFLLLFENVKAKGWVYQMAGHSKQVVEKYLELSGKDRSSLKQVSTPCIDDHIIPPDEFESNIINNIDYNRLLGLLNMPAAMHIFLLLFTL